MAHEGKRHPIAGSGNTSVAALLKKNQTNNESLFKAIASEKSHINQIGSATPDFNTVMKNYGTFSDKTWKRKVADEKARVTAFTSMPDDKSQTQLTDFDKNTKLKRKIEAENEIERVQNVKQDLLRQELSEVARGDDFSRVYDFKKQGQYQPKPVVEEKPGLVLDETTGIQTTASGQQLDAIGREINQLTTDVGQVSYSGKNTDDIAYAAQAAVVADVALTKSVKEAEKKLKIQQYDDLQAKQLADSLARTLELNKQAGIDESAFVRAGDVKSRITKIEKEKEQAAKEAEIDKIASDRLLAVEKREALEEQIKVEEEIAAFEAELVKDLKADQDSRDRLKKINDNTAKIKAGNADLLEASAQKKKDAEVAEKQRLSIDDEQSTNAKNIKTRLSAEQREKDIKQRESALQREKDVKERTRLLKEEKAEKERKQKNFESAKSNSTLGSNDALPLNVAAKLEENRRNELAGSNFVSDGPKGRGRGGVDKFRQGIDKETGLLGDPFRFSTLAYPRNATNNMANGHYLLFYVNVQNKTGFEYEGVTPSDGDYIVGDILETVINKFVPKGTDQTRREANIGGIKAQTEAYNKILYTYDRGAEKGDIGYQKRMIQSGAQGNILRHNQKVLSKGRKALTGMDAQFKTTTRITDSVAMYLPANVSSNTSVQYQDFETGMAGFLALGGSGILDKILNNDYQGAAGKFMGMSGTVLVEMLKKAGVASVSAFTGGQGIQQAFDKAFGQTLNPYLEVAFQSMGVRSFDYTFTFSPRNEEESLDAKAIIELFRFHMAPELKGAQHRYMTLPSTFDIHYMYQTSPETSRENTFYNKIATCVLTKVDVNYTPTGVKSFESGAPVSTTMTLSFMETEMLTKEKIQQGF